MLEEFVDHRKDNTAVPISEGMIQNWKGELKPKKTMCGWDLLMQTKDQSLEWVTLKEAKESFPVQLAEYAVANHLTEARACLQMVGSTCLALMESDYLKGKEPLLVDNSQVWYQVATFCQRSS